MTSRLSYVVIQFSVFAACAVAQSGPAWSGFGKDAQHSAIAPAASQTLARIHWQTPVDLAPQFSGNELLIHYGSPLITSSNTVIVPVKTGATDGFRVEAHDGGTGALKWMLNSNYILPPHNWTPSFSPALTSASRLYLPGAGGTVVFRNSVDSVTGGTGRLAFYGLANYHVNPAAYNANVMISTPITVDSSGGIFFGFQVIGSTPVPLASGIAHIDVAGHGSWISASNAAQGDPAIGQVVQNCAPALSTDEKTVYITVSSAQDFGNGYLVALDSATLSPTARVRLLDPTSGQDAQLVSDATASPTVGPDGDVYIGVLENPFPNNHDRGWMLHFDATLAQAKTPGAFGWDDTASIVDASVVPSYRGTSKYLLMTKYNNYAGAGGNGVNKVAVLDPNHTEVDPITGATVMREVLTAVGPTPDLNFRPFDPHAVREWCINSSVVDPFTKSILVNSEDGKLYRWDLTTKRLTESIVLTAGLGEAYTPTVVGPDGTVYAINNAILFAVGQ